VTTSFQGLQRMGACSKSDPHLLLSQPGVLKEPHVALPPP
jgi:hypothetical protein